MPDLKIQRLELQNFRNYDRFQLENVGDLTIFVGHNAIGKTNILEGIQLLTSSVSFRHPHINQLIKEGRSAARIQYDASDENRLINVALALEEGKRRYTVNGKAKAAADVRGILPSVTFTPDDLQLAKKSSSVKRTTLDNLGIQLTRNYYIVRRDYEKTLRYKNRLLRDEAPQALIESINETLVTCGAQLYCYRVALFNRMIPHVKRVYAQLASGEEFTASYKPSWYRVAGTEGEASEPSVLETRERLYKELQSFTEEERKRGKSLIGPHNDEISFLISGRDVATFASQGQQRSVVLAWKLAEVEVSRTVMGTSPVLLLDDVLSELDGNRREMLVSFVTEDIQTFITATDLDGFSGRLVDRARVIQLG